MSVSKPKSILIVLTGALGDIARGFAVLAPLRRELPQAHLSWLVEKRWLPLVNRHPLIDQTFFYQKQRGALAFVDVWKTLRPQHFDLCFDLQRHTKSGVFSLFSGAPIRLGFAPKNAKEVNAWFNTDYIPEISDSVSKVYHYLEFPKWLGAKVESVDFGIAAQHVQDALPQHFPVGGPPIVSIVLGSSWSSKNWVAEGYHELLSACRNEGYSVVLVGDEAQVELASRLERAATDRQGVLNLVGKTTLESLVAVLANSSVGVGPDSGPGHLCSLFGVPYVSLFGPTSPQRVSPFGSEQLVIESELSCAPCGRRVCPGLDRLCMRFISPESVFFRVQEVVKREHSSNFS